MKSANISIHINSSLPLVWKVYNTDADIIHWNYASPDWYCPSASIDFRVGGQFDYKMAAKDGSASFHFVGVYLDIIHHECIRYQLDDGRIVDIKFRERNEITEVSINFELELANSKDIQMLGWEAILHHFKAYVESQF